VKLAVLRRLGVASDIIALANRIADDNLDAALRFFDAVEHTLGGLAEMPGKGKRREFADERLSGLYSYSIDGFPNHLIFYTFDDRRLLVIAVLHGARDLPRALEERLG